MNLYNLHQSPENLHRPADVVTHVPSVFWYKYAESPDELKKREAAIAKSAQYSYHYANDVIEGRWPPGEPAITTSAKYSYNYAKDVIKGRWPPGEPAIEKSARYSYWYGSEVINQPWPPGEPAIAADVEFNTLYKEFVNKLT